MRVLMVAVVLAVVLAGCGGDEPEAYPVATNAPPATAYPAPTSDRVAEYDGWLDAILMRVALASSDLGGQSTALGQDVTLIYDSQWQDDTVDALARLIMAAGDMREPPYVPSSRIEVQSLVLDLADELEGAAHNYARSLDEIDPALMEASTEGLTRASAIVGQIGDLRD